MIIVSATHNFCSKFDYYYGKLYNNQLDTDIIPYPMEVPLGKTGPQIISDIDEKSDFITLELFWRCNNSDFYLKKEYDIRKFPNLGLKSNEVPSLIIGFISAGEVVLWWKSNIKSYVLDKQFGTELKTLPHNLKLKKQEREVINSLLGLSEGGISTYRLSNTINKWFNKFCYRYQILIGGDKRYNIQNRDTFNQEKNVWIEDLLLDGTYDKLHDHNLLQFHDSAAPIKISLNIENEYSVHLFLNEDQILQFFERFYGAHPETKADFIIRIDAENKKYELAMYRQGLKEPVVIPESAYQMIVFKNKFEDYRSANYDQPRGAWIW